MAAGRRTRLLDRTDPREIAAYERAFYLGFRRAAHNRLVRWLWEWDDAAERLRTRVPYAEQEIWVLPDAAGGVDAAIAVNTTLQTLQAAAYGFSAPVLGPGTRSCEFLTFFAVGNFSLAGKFPLWTEMFADLQARGFTHALATTAPKVLPLYRWMGAQEIARREIEGETRVFLLFDLAQRPEANAR
jgi:hypothetical protein